MLGCYNQLSAIIEPMLDAGRWMPSLFQVRQRGILESSIQQPVSVWTGKAKLRYEK
jgi:hypothetical protein